MIQSGGTGGAHAWFNITRNINFNSISELKLNVDTTVGRKLNILIPRAIPIARFENVRFWNLYIQ